MASTYTPRDGIDFVRQFVHNIPLEKVGTQLCDITNAVISRAFFWRWSISDFTAVTCTDGAQDYSSVLPSDFYRFHVLLLARTDLTPIEYRELDEKEYIGKDVTRKGGVDDIRIFSILPETSGIRLEIATAISGTVNIEIQGEYQKQPTKITDANIETAFDFPDQYFNVFTEGLLYYCYRNSDDPRAGSATTNSEGRKVYSGQLGVFMEALGEMMQKEDISGGQTSRFPSDSIGWSRATNPGLFAR